MHEYVGEEFAVSIGWHFKGEVTPVEDQGRCGSSWRASESVNSYLCIYVKRKHICIYIYILPLDDVPPELQGLLPPHPVLGIAAQREATEIIHRHGARW